MSKKADLKIGKIELKTSLKILLGLKACRLGLGDCEVGQSHFNEVLSRWNALPVDEKDFGQARNFVDQL